jgi:DNA polymerase III delta prime subunit
MSLPKRRKRTKIVSMDKFIISEETRDNKKNSEETFMPFGPPTETPQTSDNIFKSEWALYGSGKPCENNNENNIIEKYKPKDLTDIIGNKNNIKLLKNWLVSKFENTKNNYDCVLITGESGSGKSEFVRQCFKSLNYSMIEYDQSINKAEMAILSDSIIFSSIEILLSGKSKKGVIIDNYNDNLSSSQLTELLKILKKNKNSSPTIFISNEFKLLNDNALHIEFESPTNKQLLAVFKKVCTNESINISPNALEHFINNSGYNLRGCMTTINVLGNKTEEITLDNLDEIVKITQKDINLDIQDCISMFVDSVNPKFSFENRLKYTSMYTSGIIHANYPSMLKKDITIEEISEISDYISHGDVLKHYMLSKQEWNLSELAGIMGTEAPSSIIRKHYKPIRKYKVPNRYDSIPKIIMIKSNPQDICFAIGHIFFKLGNTDAAWIKHMNKSSQIFIDFMKGYYIDKDTSMKLLSMSYSFQNQNSNVIRKIRTKFRNEWKLNE